MVDTDVVPAVLEARGISKTEAKKLVRQAFALDRKAKASVSGANVAYWNLAEALYELSEIRGWELLGLDTVEEYLGQPELGLKRSTYFHAVRIWRDLVVVKGVDPERLAATSPAKIQEVVPTIMSGDVEVDRALDDAEALSKSDLRDQYAGPGGPDDNPKIKARCPTCNSLVNAEVLDVTS